MKMRSADKIRRLFAKSDVTVGSKVDDRIVDDALEALVKSEKTKSVSAQHNIWRMIMRSGITKLAAAAVIIVAVIVIINYLGGSPDGAGVAWGDVLENIDNAKTLTWKLTTTKEGTSKIYRYMVLEPYLMRVEQPDGKVEISDHRQEMALILDPAKKTATVCHTRRKTLDYYNYFLHFKDKPGLPVKRISQREINGKRAIGFHLEVPRGPNGYYGVSENNKPVIDFETVMWIDPETLLPVLKEVTMVGADGGTAHVITDEIVLNAELDESMFSLEVPAGYEIQYDSDMYDRMKSASDMGRILKACAIYNNQHGQWPDSLQELDLPGIDDSSFIYLKPSARQDARRIVLYDVYDVWENGINAGFTDYRVEFIEDEVKFRQLLEQR